MNEGYATQSKSQTNSSLHRVRENNLLTLQTMNSNQNEEALTGAVTTINLYLTS